MSFWRRTGRGMDFFWLCSVSQFTTHFNRQSCKRHQGPIDAIIQIVPARFLWKRLAARERWWWRCRVERWIISRVWRTRCEEIGLKGKGWEICKGWLRILQIRLLGGFSVQHLRYSTEECWSVMFFSKNVYISHFGLKETTGLRFTYLTFFPMDVPLGWTFWFPEVVWLVLKPSADGSAGMEPLGWGRNGSRCWDGNDESCWKNLRSQEIRRYIFSREWSEVMC